MKTKNTLLIIAIIVLISCVVVFIYDLSHIERQKEENRRINPSEQLPGQPAPPRPEDQILQVPLSGVLLTVGLIVLGFYFSYNFLEQNVKRELSVISSIADEKKKITSSENEGDVNSTVMNLLNPNERRIVNQLIENHGVCLQSDISRINNMGKVKAHRYLRNLLKMGIVNIERYGNTNKVMMSDHVKKLFAK